MSSGSRRDAVGEGSEGAAGEGVEREEGGEEEGGSTPLSVSSPLALGRQAPEGAGTTSAGPSPLLPGRRGVFPAGMRRSPSLSPPETLPSEGWAGSPFPLGDFDLPGRRLEAGLSG